MEVVGYDVRQGLTFGHGVLPVFLTRSYLAATGSSRDLCDVPRMLANFLSRNYRIVCLYDTPDRICKKIISIVLILVWKKFEETSP